MVMQLVPLLGKATCLGDGRRAVAAKQILDSMALDPNWGT